MTRYTSTTYRGKHVTDVFSKPSYFKTKPDDADILTYIVGHDEEGKPELIADRIYGDSQLYWVLVGFNSLYYTDAVASNVFNWPTQGQTVYYPTMRIVSLG